MLLPSQVRVNKEQDHVLISPRGLSFSEVTAANLVSTIAVYVCVFAFSSHDSESLNFSACSWNILNTNPIFIWVHKHLYYGSVIIYMKI